MKIKITFVLLVALPAICFAQNPYYDALTLKKYGAVVNKKIEIKLNASNHKEIVDIFKRYVNHDFDELETEINVQSQNPFISISGVTHTDGSEQSQKSSFGLSALNSIGGLDVTNLADGLAKFLVARAKQELSITFFEQFKKDMESIKQLQIIFPSTYRALQAIDKEIYNYAAYIDLLRESFQKDLSQLLPDIEKLIDDPCMNTIFLKYPEVRTMLSDAAYIAKSFEEGNHPGEIVHLYVADKIDSAKLRLINMNLYPAWQTLDLLSQSIRSKQTSQYWIGADSLALVMKDNTSFRIYLGLLYQQTYQNKIYFGSKSLDASLKQAKDSLDLLVKRFEPFLRKLVEKGKAVDHYFTIIKTLQQAGKDKPSYQDYYSLYDATLNLTEHVTTATTVLNLPALNKYDVRIEKYLSAARGLGNIYVDVYEKQYTSAIVELSTIYEHLILNEYHAAKDSLTVPMLPAAVKEKLISRISSFEFLKDQEKVVSLIVKYGALASAIANAKNSDEVEKVIEAMALPAGSARIKREALCNVSLNAYLGLSAGYEKLYAIKDKSKQWAFAPGLSAPIGVAVSWGNIKCNVNRGGKSFTLFASLVDIGALASFRFQNDSSSVTPAIKLQNIISPGLFTIWGFGNVPLSLSLGAQLGPQLRNVNSTQANIDQNYYLRLSASLLVDIPLLNLHTKPR